MWRLPVLMFVLLALASIPRLQGQVGRQTIETCHQATKGDRVRGMALNAEAWALAAMGQYEAALVSLERAMALWPDGVSQYMLGGHLRLNLDEYDGARADYERVIAVEPSNAEARVGRADALIHLGLPDPAIEELDRAIALDDGEPLAFLLRGIALIDRWRAHFVREDIRRAIEDFDRAIALDPNNGEAFYQRAWAHRRLDHDVEAARDFKRAYDLGIR